VTARAAPAGKPAPADATMLLPSASLRFDLAPEEIGGLTNALVEQLRQASQDVLDIPPECVPAAAPRNEDLGPRD